MALSTNAAINAILTAITGAALPQSNWIAEVAPESTNNASEGYSAGSMWLDVTTGIIYLCSASSESDATWNSLGNTAKNGVKLLENQIQLGGRLTQDTNIIPMSYGLSISPTDPDPSAVLDVQSTTKGFKLPVMSGAQRDAIVSPAKGLMVYSNTDDIVYYFNGTSWLGLQII